MWGLGCLIWEVFNGTLPRQSALKGIENVSLDKVKSKLLILVLLSVNLAYVVVIC